MSAASVAIVGCGLIGHKRAKALGGARLAVCADIAQDRADRLAATAVGCKAVTDWRQAVSDPAVRDMEIVGLGQAFHVPGSLPGEAESQIFIQTKSGDPMSLVVLSRPGQTKRFSVATGDIIDDAAAGVKDGSLLWYQLACGLPRALPASSLSTLDASTAASAREDYRFVIDSLGRCDRNYSAGE